MAKHDLEQARAKADALDAERNAAHTALLKAREDFGRLASAFTEAARDTELYKAAKAMADAHVERLHHDMMKKLSELMINISQRSQEEFEHAKRLCTTLVDAVSTERWKPDSKSLNCLHSCKQWLEYYEHVMKTNPPLSRGQPATESQIAQIVNSVRDAIENLNRQDLLPYVDRVVNFCVARHAEGNNKSTLPLLAAFPIVESNFTIKTRNGEPTESVIRTFSTRVHNLCYLYETIVVPAVNRILD